MIVIPMAGQSSRFYSSGFTVAKHLLPLHNSDVLYWNLRSLESHFESDQFVFINLKSNHDSERIVELCKSFKISNFDIFTLNTTTLGQAETIFRFTSQRSEPRNKENLHIFNIDTIRPQLTFPKIRPNTAWLEVFIGQGNHWSFALEHPLTPNRVTSVAEKDRISNWCSTGAYSFGSTHLFNSAYNLLYSPSERAGEKYVAPLLQTLIVLGYEVTMTKILSEQMISCGIPSEYENCSLMNLEELFHK